MTYEIGNSKDSAMVTQSKAWMEFACAVIGSLSTHAFRWNESDYEHFRRAMVECLEALKSNPSPSSLLISAGALSQRIEHYHQNMRQMVDKSRSELHDIIRVLMSAIDQAKLNSNDSLGVLHQIEETIEKTSTVEDLRNAKVRLKDALAKLVEKANERKQSAEELTISLQERILIMEGSFAGGADHLTGKSPASSLEQRVPGRASEGSLAELEESKNSLAFRGNPEAQLDLLTGLPNKVAAENAILGLRGRPNFYLACYYVRGLEFLTVRYGDKIANEVLFLSAQSIANTSHGATDQLFRWRGPAFVAIIQREDNLIDVERNVQRMIGPKLQFYLRGGTMLVSVTLGVGVFSAAESNCAEVIRDVENFFLLPAIRGC